MKRAVAMLLALVVLTALAVAVQGVAGPYRVDLKTDPAVIAVGRAKLLVAITDSSGKPVSGAEVKAIVQMPGMTMGEREETGRPGATPGTYVIPVVFAMAGGYEAKISVKGPLGAGETKLDLATGQSTATGPSGFPYGTALLIVLGVGALLFVLSQMRRIKQGVNWRSLFSAQVVISLLLLGIVLAIATWAVNTQRRPGAMTPLEAQVMEMNTPAPEGTLPVRLAKAESKPFTETLTYSGQAVGFVEQDVVPRVTGVIVWMPYYVGTKVKKGQLLARLDTSQLDPMVSEKAAGVSTAQQGVGVAAMEYQQALNMVTQARAEVSMAEGEVAESKAMLTAAQQGRGTAESMVESAQAEVNAMQAELTSAQADRNYQDEELQRMKQLFDQGAISKSEWQRAQADAQKSSADVDKARENVARAQSGVRSARAELRKVDAEISGARRKVQQAEAQVRAKRAGVETARSAAAAAKSKIGQSRAGVAEAAAGLKGASTQLGYAELRSEVDGVITQRVISPGVVVAPGQSVLRVAQISPIRLQANVPEADLTRVQVGATVKIAKRNSKQNPVTARVTSISPSVDPNSRTGVVEAIYTNSEARFLPGQYLSMEISVGSNEPSVVIPNAALQTEEHGSFVWVAKAAMNGEFSVSRREVQIGGRGGENVAVTSGITGGEQVVVAPPQGLTPETRVTSSHAPTQAAANQTVEITEAGYSPPSISVPANKPFKVTFIRRASESCGTEVIFPDLGIRKTLPLNQPVTIDIPAQPGGKELRFTCPMNMLKGKAVAR
jgi:RND family efflux transporter MFP subunit